MLNFTLHVWMYYKNMHAIQRWEKLYVSKERSMWIFENVSFSNNLKTQVLFLFLYLWHNDYLPHIKCCITTMCFIKYSVLPASTLMTADVGRTNKGHMGQTSHAESWHHIFLASCRIAEISSLPNNMKWMFKFVITKYLKMFCKK